MSDGGRFEELCGRVRFSLDSSEREAPRSDSKLDDFIARVRSSGLRVKPTTVPTVAAAVERVAAALRLEAEPEVYVVADPTANAFAPVFGSGHRPLVVLNSGLVQLVGANDLDFIIGHELGHLGLRHGGGPDDAPHRSEFETLQQRSAQRYAEVSADRIGMLAARSVFAAAHVMVKTASGLTSEFVKLDIDSFVRQLDRDPGAVNRSWELEQSHPSLPFRLWAALRFAHTAEYGEIAGQGTDGTPLADVDREIELRFSEMGDGKLTKMEEEIAQKALVWAAAALVLETGGIDDDAKRSVGELVGEELTGKAFRFAETHGRDPVFEKLENAITRVNAAGSATRENLRESFVRFAEGRGVDPGETESGRKLESLLR